MAEKNTKVITPEIYTVSELADGHKVFGVHRDVVLAALKMANVETATEAEAKKIIEEYAKKEV